MFINHDEFKTKIVKNADFIFIFSISVLSFLLKNLDLDKVTCIFIFMSLFLLTLRKPEIVLMGLLPLSFLPHPFPQSISYKEILFAALLFFVLVILLLKSNIRALIYKIIKIYLWPLLILLAMLIVNFYIARSNLVSLGDWLRGLAPFLFIMLSIPIAGILLEKEANTKVLAFSLIIASLLFSLDVIIPFFGQTLWIAKWKYFYNGQEILSNLDKIPSGLAKELYGFIRVTLLVVRSTDAMLPLGVVISFCSALIINFNKNKFLYILNLLLILASTYAVFATYTRSMILSCMLIIISIAPLVALYNRKLLKKYCSLLVFVFFIAATFLYYFQVNNIILGRFSKLFFSTKQVMQSEGLKNSKQVDVNVSIRAEEYKIAYNMFLKNKTLGNGLGIKHSVSSEDLNGNPIQIQVSYIHNWPLYILMIGGALGFIMYAYPIATSVFYAFSNLDRDFNGSLIVVSSLGVLFLYSLFFAVFRLISFNLILSYIYGYVIYKKIDFSNEKRV